MEIDAQELDPMKIDEFRVGGYFYRLEPNGKYSMCVITADDIKDGVRQNELMVLTEMYHREGRLFVSRNQPWKPITKL